MPKVHTNRSAYGLGAGDPGTGSGGGGSSNNDTLLVSAGADRSAKTGTTGNLSGAVTNGSGTFSYLWEQISGPVALPATPNTPITTVTFPSAGTYVYAFTATASSGQTATDLVTFTVTDYVTNPPVDTGSRILYLHSKSWLDVINEIRGRVGELGIVSQDVVGYFSFSVQMNSSDRWVEDTPRFGPGKGCFAFQRAFPNGRVSWTWAAGPEGPEVARSTHSNFAAYKAHVERWGSELKQAQDAGHIHKDIIVALGHEFTGDYLGVQNYSVNMGHSTSDFAYWFAKTRELVLNQGASVRFALAPNKLNSDVRVVNPTAEVISHLGQSNYDIFGISAYPEPSIWISGKDASTSWKQKNSLYYWADVANELSDGKEFFINEIGFQRTLWHFGWDGKKHTSNAVDRTTQMEEFWQAADDIGINHIKYFNKSKVPSEEFRMADDTGDPTATPLLYDRYGAEYVGERAFTRAEQTIFVRGMSEWAKGTGVSGGGGSGGGTTQPPPDPIDPTPPPPSGLPKQFKFIQDADIVHEAGGGASQWIVPKVNWPAGGMYAYANGGAFYARFEVVDKPSTKLVSGQLCIWQRYDSTWDTFEETCSPWRSLQFTEPGVHYVKFPNPLNWHTAPKSETSPRGVFNWAQNTFDANDVMRLFMRSVDDGNSLMSYDGAGKYKYPKADLDKHIPITVKQEWWAVLPGETFIPPASWTGNPWTGGDTTPPVEPPVEPPQAEFPDQIGWSSASSVSEGGQLVLNVKRSGTGAGAASVKVSAYSFTAREPVDYSVDKGKDFTLSWADGEIGNKSFVLYTVEDIIVEGNETVNFHLNSPSSNVVISGDPYHVVAILNDDTAVPDPGETPRTSGPPTSTNGASSFHINWRPNYLTEGVTAVEVDFEPLAEPPNDVYWALAMSFGSNSSTFYGGGHLGLQRWGGYPNNHAVNWGGYFWGGSELDGTTSTLPSALNNPHTFNYNWAVGNKYRLRVFSPSPGRWRGVVTDLFNGQTTVIRDLICSGHLMYHLSVWTESFCDCAQQVHCRWSRFMVERGSSVQIPITQFELYHQTYTDGGCTNTSTTVVGGSALEQKSATPRVNHTGTWLELPTIVY